MNNRLLFLPILILFSILSSCEKESVDKPQEQEPFDDGVFISCEGAFGSGNATVYFLDPAQSVYYANIFNSTNNTLVGDVLQSIHFDNDKAYLVVNNSGKIIEVDDETFVQSRTIEGLSSPTEIVTSGNKGFIGSLYSQHILVTDLNSLTITDSLFLGVQSNKITEEDNHLWILSQSEYQGRVKNQLYSIDIANGQVDSIGIGSNPLDWAYDDDRIYVYCQGEESVDDPGIYTINTVDHVVEKTTNLNVETGYFSKIAYDDYKERLLVQLSDGIYSYDPGSGTLSTSPLMTLADVQFLYALAISPDDGDIYVGDAKDFNSAGAVYIYSSDGQAKGSLPVGIGPNNFYFE